MKICKLREEKKKWKVHEYNYLKGRKKAITFKLKLNWKKNEIQIEIIYFSYIKKNTKLKLKVTSLFH